jgi:hypothetical protein
MTKLMPLRRVVVEVTHEATANDPQGIRRAVKSWHNRLANGSVPRSLTAKLGRELFLDLDAWEDWITGRQGGSGSRPRGRPRSSGSTM